MLGGALRDPPSSMASHGFFLAGSAILRQGHFKFCFSIKPTNYKKAIDLVLVREKEKPRQKALPSASCRRLRTSDPEALKDRSKPKFASMSLGACFPFPGWFQKACMAIGHISIFVVSRGLKQMEVFIHIYME